MKVKVSRNLPKGDPHRLSWAYRTVKHRRKVYLLWAGPIQVIWYFGR